MKRIPLICLLLLMASSHAWAWTSQELSDFGKANQNYRDGKFKEAADDFESLSLKHPDSGVLLFNLGNAYHRLGKSGKAILAYERARQIIPRDPDLRYNLGYVRGHLRYKMEDKRNWYLKTLEEILITFTGREMILGALGVYFFLAGAWVFALYFQEGAPWGFWRKSFLALCLVFLAAIGAKNAQAWWLRGALVTTREAQIRYGPSDSDQLAFRLGEGLKIYVMDRRDDWSRILMTNGETGWVRNEQIEEIKTS